MFFVRCTFLSIGRFGFDPNSPISPQVHADNLKCNSYDADTLLAAAQYTVSYVRVVGQEASPSKCVLLSTTSKTASKRMTAQCALAGTLSNRVKEATSQVIAVGAVSMELQRMLGMVPSKYLSGWLRGCEGSAVHVSSQCRPSCGGTGSLVHKIPMTDTPALLSLLDSPWDLTLPSW